VSDTPLSVNFSLVRAPSVPVFTVEDILAVEWAYVAPFYYNNTRTRPTWSP
jgi:hypothetical protein